MNGYGLFRKPGSATSSSTPSCFTSASITGRSSPSPRIKSRAARSSPESGKRLNQGGVVLLRGETPDREHHRWIARPEPWVIAGDFGPNSQLGRHDRVIDHADPTARNACRLCQIICYRLRDGYNAVCPGVEARNQHRQQAHSQVGCKMPTREGKSIALRDDHSSLAPRQTRCPQSDDIREQARKEGCRLLTPQVAHERRDTHDGSRCSQIDKPNAPRNFSQVRALSAYEH